MITISKPTQTGFRGSVGTVFDRLVRRHTDAYALVAAVVTLAAIAVIH